MNMKRLLLFLAALLCCIVLANAQEKYRVTANFPVKIWSSASDNRVAIGSLNPNTPVDVYGKTGDWLKIKYNGNKYGYVFLLYKRKRHRQKRLRLRQKRIQQRL